jgi:hypothetical protein
MWLMTLVFMASDARSVANFPSGNVKYWSFKNLREASKGLLKKLSWKNRVRSCRQKSSFDL